jgi:predicted transcriptional regulator
LKIHYYYQSPDFGFRVTSPEAEDRFQRRAARNPSRGIWDIMAKILAVCSGEIVSKYQVTMRANLNSKSVERYLNILLTAGFLSQPGMDYFQTSMKGSEFLKQYRIVKSALGEIEMVKELFIPFK